MTNTMTNSRSAGFLNALGTITVLGLGRAAATAAEILSVLGASVDWRHERADQLDVRAFDSARAVICDVIETGVPKRYADEVAQRPRGVWITVSGFGLDGPLAGARSSDLISAAAGGLLSTVSDPAGRFYPMPGQQALQVAGQTAALALLHGISITAGGSQPVHLDLSAQEAAAFCSIQQEVSHRLYECKGPAGASRYATPSGTFRCTDGEIGIIVLDDHQWQRAAKVVGEPSWPVEYPTVQDRLAHRDVINAAVEQWTSRRSKFICEELLQAGGVAAVALRTLDEVRHLGQMEHRAFFPDDDADGIFHTAVFPGLISTGEAAPRTRPRGGALTDLRVVEASNVLAGPLAGAILGAMGAEIVRLEEEERLDIYRRNGPFKHGVPGPERAGYFLMANYCKRSVHRGIGRDPATVKAVCARADVLLENLGNRRLEHTGIRSREMFAGSGKCSVSISGFGGSGPCADYKAYAPNVHAFGGLATATQQYAGADATMRTSFADYCVAVWGAMVTAAWWLGDGDGCAIDLSMAEVVAAKLSGLRLSPSAGGMPDAGREFLIRCPDGQQVAVATDQSRRPDAVEAALGLADAEVGRSHAGDVIILDVSAGPSSSQEILDLAAGAEFPMSAYLAKTPDQVLEDAQLAERDFLHRLSHPEVGSSYIFALPWKEAFRPRTGYRRAPLLGEDDEWMEEVLTQSEGPHDAARD
jgi:crotonobetainyl-CoA:carnitine CoA-transferase CaiB-like acyl-CoA transferase